MVPNGHLERAGERLEGQGAEDISAARGGPRARGGLSVPQAAGPPVHFIFQNLTSRCKNRTVQIDVLTALIAGAARAELRPVHRSTFATHDCEIAAGNAPGVPSLHLTGAALAQEPRALRRRRLQVLRDKLVALRAVEAGRAKVRRTILLQPARVHPLRRGST